MNKPNQFVVFSLDEHKYALHVSTIERIIRADEITRLPNGPGITLGVININGRIVPVINTRKGLHLRQKKIELNDLFIIANTHTRTVAIVADSVNNVIECSAQDVIIAKEFLSGVEHVEAVTKFEDDIIFIHNLNNLLSLEDEKMLNNAMK